MTSWKRRSDPSAQKKLSRRQMIAGVAGVGLAATQRPQSPDDSTKLQGRPPTERGERSVYETPERLVSKPEPAATSKTPLHELEGILTPSDLHFERHHGGIPRIDPDDYRLLIHGLVESPTVFTLADLKRFPSVTRTYFLECSGNGSRAYRSPREDDTVQTIDGLFSTSEWTGVPLAIVLEEVGASQDARWFLAEGQDAAVMTRSVPLTKGYEDALLAFAQNGEALRPAQGYPLRLFLPGWEGNTSVKWLRRLELSDRPFMSREETSKYTDPLPDGTARLFSFVMDAKSTILSPTPPTVLSEPGVWPIEGIAWSGRGKITRVELSTDGGRSWEDAELQEPVLSKSTTRFRKLWTWDGETAVLMSRATDETGYVQPTHSALERVRGLGTRYHLNQIRTWRVERDGRVVFQG